MDSKLNNFEKYLKEKILSDLDKGRPDFDKPHTIAVVCWLKQILDHSQTLNLDETVLLIAAYAHDWGYVGMFNHGQKLQHDDVKNAKAEHMKLGAEKLEDLLGDKIFSFLTDVQKSRCVHLISVHDSLEELKDDDELVLMEADTLGALDVDFVKPTFDFESNDKYMRGVRGKRVPKFITEFSKKNVEGLIQGRMDYYSKN